MKNRGYKVAPQTEHAYRPNPRTGGCADCGSMYDMQGHVLYRRRLADRQYEVDRASWPTHGPVTEVCSRQAE